MALSGWLCAYTPQIQFPGTTAWSISLRVLYSRYRQGNIRRPARLLRRDGRSCNPSPEAGSSKYVSRIHWGPSECVVLLLEPRTRHSRLAVVVIIGVSGGSMCVLARDHNWSFGGTHV